MAAADPAPPVITPRRITAEDGQGIIGARVARWRRNGTHETGLRVVGTPTVRGRQRQLSVPVVGEEAWWRFAIAGEPPTPRWVAARTVWIIP